MADNKFDYEGAKALAKNIKLSAEKVKNLLDDSDKSVKRVQNNWHGRAADAAQADWNKWKKDFEEYYAILIQNVTNIETAAANYSQTEATIIKDFN